MSSIEDGEMNLIISIFVNIELGVDIRLNKSLVEGGEALLISELHVFVVAFSRTDIQIKFHLFWQSVRRLGEQIN